MSTARAPVLSYSPATLVSPSSPICPHVFVRYCIAIKLQRLTYRVQHIQHKQKCFSPQRHPLVLLVHIQSKHANLERNVEIKSAFPPLKRGYKELHRTPRAIPAVFAQLDRCMITKACEATARHSLRQHSTSVYRDGIKSCGRIRRGLSTTWPARSPLFIKEESHRSGYSTS